MADQKAAVGKTALEVIPVGRAPPPGKAPPPKKSSAPPPDGKGVVPKPAASLPIGHRVNVKSLPGKAAPEVEKLRATLAERKANNAKAQDQQLTTDSTSVAGKAGSGALAVKLLAKATPASKTPARLAVSAAKDAGNAPC